MMQVLCCAGHVAHATAHAVTGAALTAGTLWLLHQRLWVAVVFGIVLPVAIGKAYAALDHRPWPLAAYVVKDTIADVAAQSIGALPVLGGQRWKAVGVLGGLTVGIGLWLSVNRWGDP